MANFPASKDNLSTTTSPNATLQASSHAALHNNANSAINALEDKVGITSDSTQSSHDYKLSGVANGDKAVSLTGTETLTNKTLTTPQVDTINEKTSGNGVTVDGLNIKDNKLNTNDSVVTSNITDDAVTPPKLSLGQDQQVVATEQTTISTSYTDLSTAGPTVTYTAPTGGATVLIVYHAKVTNSTSGNTSWVGVDVSGVTTDAVSDANASIMRPNSAGVDYYSICGFRTVTLNAGVNTIKMKYRVEGGTGSYYDRRLLVLPIG